VRVEGTSLVTVWGTWHGVTALMTSRDLLGRSDGSGWGNNTKKVKTAYSCLRGGFYYGQNRIVMSTRGFLLLWFRINRNRSSDRSSSTQASCMSARACVREGGPLLSACSDVDCPYCRGAPASTSTGRFLIAHVECRESEEGNQALNQGGQWTAVLWAWLMLLLLLPKK